MVKPWQTWLAVPGTEGKQLAWSRWSAYLPKTASWELELSPRATIICFILTCPPLCPGMGTLLSYQWGASISFAQLSALELTLWIHQGHEVIQSLAEVASGQEKRTACDAAGAAYNTRGITFLQYYKVAFLEEVMVCQCCRMVILNP